jgi:hypothetical protein
MRRTNIANGGKKGHAPLVPDAATASTSNSLGPNAAGVPNLR